MQPPPGGEAAANRWQQDRYGHSSVRARAATISTLTDFAVETIIRTPVGEFLLATRCVPHFARSPIMQFGRFFSRGLKFAWAAAFISFAGLATAADSVNFNCRAPQVGHYGTHDVKYELDLDVSVHQGAKVVSSEQQQLVRNQTRQITVLKVDGDRVTQVRAHYPKARATIARGKQNGGGDTQPIEGKTYIVERTAENKLIITDADGNDVPEAERSLVAASMESVGRPNPLGKFLHGKSVAIGQTLTLPNELAADLLGLRETGGNAQKVELTLKAVRQEPDRRVAQFDMLVVIKPDANSSLDIKGDIQLDINTCQVAAANFTGPVAIAETVGPEGHTFEIRSDGNMRVAIRSHYAIQ
jgi:hypothetical protein